MPNSRKYVVERVSLSSVRDAYFRGDFEECIRLCEVSTPRDETERIEVVLWRARALIPLNRADHALEILRGLRLMERSLDEYLTAKMLTGAAYVSLGQADRGAEVLGEALRAADGVHRTIRADIAVHLGIAHYRKGELDAALRVLRTVPADADIIHARAALYMAWVAWAQNDFETAADRFETALHCIDSCSHHDRFVEAYTLYGLTMLCAELPRLRLWEVVKRRVERFDWSVSGIAIPRFWIAIAASCITELCGDFAQAQRWATRAEETAPSPSSLIVAWCRLAELFGRYGESRSQVYFVSKARERYDELSRDGLLRDERSLPLALAGELTQTETPEDAAPLLTYYAEVIAPRAKGDPEEPKLEAHRALVEGFLQEGRGQRTLARHRYEAALARFAKMNFRRSASIVAYRLAVLTGEEQYRSFITDALHEASDAYWIKARLAEAGVAGVHLSERHVEVLRLLVRGKSNKEIASIRGGSWYTARNIVRELLQMFGVQGRAELVRIAIARGLVADPQETTAAATVQRGSKGHVAR